MKSVFDESGYYVPERDGNLDEYLEKHDGFSSVPLFRGIRIYEQLWKEGYLQSDYSYIRLMLNVGREDEHFQVIERGRLRGIELQAHSGRKGEFDATEIITQDGPCFEVGNIVTKKRR